MLTSVFPFLLYILDLDFSSIDLSTVVGQVPRRLCCKLNQTSEEGLRLTVGQCGKAVFSSVTDFAWLSARIEALLSTLLLIWIYENYLRGGVFIVVCFVMLEPIDYCLPAVMYHLRSDIWQYIHSHRMQIWGYYVHKVQLKTSMQPFISGTSIVYHHFCLEGI